MTLDVRNDNKEYKKSSIQIEKDIIDLFCYSSNELNEMYRAMGKIRTSYGVDYLTWWMNTMLLLNNMLDG